MVHIMEKNRILSRTVLHAIIAVYGICCLWLYYRQSIADLSVAGTIPFQSDLPLHISMVIEDGWYYSFTAYIYMLLYALFQGSTVGIAGFLALVSVATIYATEELVCYLGRKKRNTWKTLALAVALNFVMPIFIPTVGEFRYVSYQSANIWHNSTYLCMRLMAVITILVYFKLEEHYSGGLKLKEWCTFALLNVICTGIKPSFFVAFSPVVGIFLLVDLFKKVPLNRIIVFGSALLPSGFVLLWQNAVLFGESTGNGMEIKPWYTFSLHANSPKLAVICSVLFCGLVILATFKRERKDRRYLFLIVMALLGFAEALCLVESGSRSVDGNFLWGYSICLFLLFVVCAVKCAVLKKSTRQRVLRALLGVVFLLHLYCGGYFFIQLLAGASYWMK